MERYLLFIIISCLCSTSSLCAGKSFFDPYTYNGSVELENKTVPHLTINGASQLSHIIVEGTMKLHGSVTAKDCLFFDVTSSSSLRLDKTTVKGKLFTKGDLIANSSSFHDTVSIGGELRTTLSQYESPIEVEEELDAENCVFNTIKTKDDVRLINTNTHSITCNSLKPRSIFLQGTSEVLQDIIFTTASGTVFAERQEQIRGTIRGGTLILRPSTSIIEK